MKLCNLEVLLMDNGEVICLGKVLGWKDDFKNYLVEKKSSTAL